MFVWEPPGRPWTAGAAARWWLWHSLAALRQALFERGSRLVLAVGEPAHAVSELARAAGADTVVWAAGLDPGEHADDIAVAGVLRADGVRVVVPASRGLLLDPPGPLTRDGRPYIVFTPYWRACLAELRDAGTDSAPVSPLAAWSTAPVPPVPPEPGCDAVPPAPERLPPAPPEPARADLAALAREAKPAWSAGFAGCWHPGEAGAHARLAAFLDGALEGYEARRDRPDLDGTSRLSPHLHWGELTPGQVRRAVEKALAAAGAEPWPAARAVRDGGTTAPDLSLSAGDSLRQLGWREFGQHLLRNFPDTPDRPLHRRYAQFPWREDEAALEAWRRGQTGYPFVDAGMRELWTTGWMHNRTRLVTASFLVKDLLLSWRLGEQWFWDTLVDADLADNTLGWQWVAGSGADAAPYFRIFNPVTQGRRFDPDGTYVRRWVPELGGLPARYVHAPWLAPRDVLAAAGVVLGESYPLPVVDHGEARARALAAYDGVKNAPLEADPPGT